MASERWRDITDLPYCVSDKGRVRRLGATRVLFIGYDRYGHVVLFKNNLCHRRLVHRLVAKAFIPNPTQKPEVNHINGDGHDNRVENLEWTTRAENRTHALTISTYFKLNQQAANEIRERYPKGGISQRELGRQYGVSQGTIKDVLNRRTWNYDQAN